MKQLDYRPLVAVTTGDPAGVGPERMAKALSHPEAYVPVRPLVVGDRWVFEHNLADLSA